MFTQECLIREAFPNVLGLLIKNSRRLVELSTLRVFHFKGSVIPKISKNKLISEILGIMLSLK